MEEWHYQPALAKAAAVQSRKISAAELLQLQLRRVAEHNPALNAVIALDAERAMARAKAIDAAIAKGEAVGPLAGVPMTVKESFDVAGLSTTWGLPELAGNVAAAHAATVDALLAAGAVIFGKTNVPPYLSDWQSFNAMHGASNNPWDLARTPGGSSGGAAAALAAGLSALELGSDIGASVRCPAHFCGLFGHKPSFGVVPQHGHWIPGVHVPMDMLVCGPLARSAEDLAAAFELLAAPEPIDRGGWKLALPPARKERLADYRVAVKLDDPNCAVDDEITACLQQLAERLAAAGARVDDKARPKIDTMRAHEIYTTLLRGASGGMYREATYQQALARAAQLRPDDQSASARQLRGVVQSHRSWFLAHEERQAVRAAWGEFFRDWDVLICPVASMPAFPHDHRDRAQRTLLINGREEEFNLHVPGFWAGIASMPYLPASVAPAGRTRSGLPVGVQIVGPYLEDRTTLKFAQLVAEDNGGFVPPPAFP